MSQIKAVGRSGQISLGKKYVGKVLRVERLEDGSILLTAVAMVPENVQTNNCPNRRCIDSLDYMAPTLP